MYRLRNVRVNEQTSIVKIEGELREDSLSNWQKELETIRNNTPGDIILNCAALSFVSPLVVPYLKKISNSRTYLLNCSPIFRNTLQAAGLSSMLLD